MFDASATASISLCWHPRDRSAACLAQVFVPIAVRWVSALGWPANQERDAVYPYAEVDSKEQKLTGANKYTVTFPNGQLPPVKGFFVDHDVRDRQGLVVHPNELNKFTVSERDKLKPQRRRLDDALFPERVARQGQGSQRAA